MENYQNLYYGKDPSPVYQTPGYPSHYIKSKNKFDINTLIKVASADMQAQIENSPYGCMPALNCKFDADCPGETVCNANRCTTKSITKPTNQEFQYGTVNSFGEYFSAL